ncbi:hypothetical protein D9M71_236910 [compost metagenome]
MTLAELAQLGDGPLGTLAEKPCLVGSAEGAEGADLRPPGHHESAIAPGGATTTDILLEDHDAAVRLVLLDGQGGPESNESAANYCHLGLALAFERRAG